MLKSSSASWVFDRVFHKFRYVVFKEKRLDSHGQFTTVAVELIFSLFFLKS